MVSKTSKRGRVGLVIGLLVAAAGVAGTIVLRNVGTNTQPATANVVIAAEDIPAATTITSAMLSSKEVASTSVPPGSFSDPSTLVGEEPQLPITKGTIVVSSDFVQIAAGSGVSPAPGGVVPAGPTGLLLKDGYVAIAMPVDPEIAVGYYIQAHDHVDFILGNGPAAGGPGSGVRYGFQDVEVLAVGGSPGAGAAATPRQDGLIVVALPRRQAEELSLMLAAPAQAPMTVIRLVLRPKDAYGKGQLDSGPDSPFTGSPPNDPLMNPQALANMFKAG